MSAYKIIIKNNSNNSNRSYNIYSSPPAISGGGYGNPFQVVWYKTPDLDKGDQDVFKYSPDFYAISGKSSVNSNSLDNNTEVYTQSAYKVKIGTTRNDGSQVLVSGNLKLSQDDTKAQNGSYELLTVSEISSPNRYVMGLGRQRDGNQSVDPVGVVELKPSISAVFTPKMSVIVTAGTLESGVINKSALGEHVVVQFSGNQQQATVTEGADGKFTVDQ